MRRKSVPREELVQYYYEDELSLKETAERFGVSEKTIYNRMDEYGLEARSCGHPRKVTAGAEELRRLYEDEGKTLDDLSERFDCTQAAVLRFLERYGIERRSRGSGTSRPYATRLMDERGYIEWNVDADTHTNQYEHRMVAIGEFGLDAVAGKDIHHKNGIPWDNRPENLEPLTTSEHQKRHHG